MKRFKSQFGFTLIETMAAIFVLSIGLISVLIVFPTVAGKLTQAEQITQASFLAQAKIEDLISQPYDAVTTGQTTETDLSANFSKFSRTTVVTYTDDTGANLGTDSGLKKISVTITNKNTNKNIYQLSSLFGQR